MVTMTQTREASRARMGRPPKLSRELIGQLAELITEGNYKETAAQAVGISRTTYYNWTAKAEELDGLIGAEGEPELTEDQQLYVDFLYVVKHAEAWSEVELVRKVQSGHVHWQAHMTMLERRFPPRWRKRDETEVTVKDEREAMTDEEYERELAGFGMPAAIAVAAGPSAVEPPPDA